MIRSLYGEVLSATETTIILDVGGLGFDILCSRAALSHCSLGARVRLTTYMQISEAGAALFGFIDETERELFLKITTIKGIGGRTGMAILGVLSTDDIVRAVSLADVDAFMRVPGVGRKTAERLCFELKNSLSGEFVSTLPLRGTAAPSARAADTVGDALRALGFSQSDAGEALSLVRAARGEEFEAMDEEALLKATLKVLQRGQKLSNGDGF